MGIEKQPKPDWSPLPRTGCNNVEFRVLLGSDDLAIANLKFQKDATIDNHAAPFDIDVLCISGSGFTSIGDNDFPFSEGEKIRWPKGKMYCLWTIDTTMETIMVERHHG
jgi:quercetin dioxygenase-like cupin family protein